MTLERESKDRFNQVRVTSCMMIEVRLTLYGQPPWVQKEVFPLRIGFSERLKRSKVNSYMGALVHQLDA